MVPLLLIATMIVGVILDCGGRLLRPLLAVAASPMPPSRPITSTEKARPAAEILSRPEHTSVPLTDDGTITAEPPTLAAISSTNLEPDCSAEGFSASLVQRNEGGEL